MVAVPGVPQARINLMETPTGVQVTSREDAPPQPLSNELVHHRHLLLALRHRLSGSSSHKKDAKVTSHSSASATPARPSTETLHPRHP